MEYLIRLWLIVSIRWTRASCNFHSNLRENENEKKQQITYFQYYFLIFRS